MKHQVQGFSIIIQSNNTHNDEWWGWCPSHFMIQSGQQVWWTAKLPNLSESSLTGGLWGQAQRSRSVEGWALVKPETAPTTELNWFRQIWRRSRRQNRWLDWIMHSLKVFSIAPFNALCNMTYSALWLDSGFFVGGFWIVSLILFITE